MERCLHGECIIERGFDIKPITNCSKCSEKIEGSVCAADGRCKCPDGKTLYEGQLCTDQTTFKPEDSLGGKKLIRLNIILAQMISGCACAHPIFNVFCNKFRYTYIYS